MVNPGPQIIGNGLGFTILAICLTELDLALRHLLVRAFGFSFQFGQQQVNAFLQGIARPQLFFIPENDYLLRSQASRSLSSSVYFPQTGLHPQQCLHACSQLCLLLIEVTT